jgi:PAS domain-containing protein
MIQPKPFIHPDISEYLGNTKELVNIFKRVNACFYVFDQKHGRVVYANKSVLNILGYSISEITSLGNDWIRKVVHPDDFAMFSRHVANYPNLVLGQKSRIVYRVIDINGDYQKIESTAFAIAADEANLVIGISKPAELKTVTDSSTPVSSECRCTNCDKLLGKELIQDKIFEVKCNRCGEFNALKSK